jgi:hypothetical protein
MDNFKPYYRLSLYKRLIVFMFTIVFNVHSVAANLPLEILQPQPNLDTKNRYYKAYPGLEYNVRLAVSGGEFPYQFSLTNAPEGLTIDNRGEISWPDPKVSDTPYQVTVSVTDSESILKSISWSITVTTEGFIFVDAINGASIASGGLGTETKPFKTMKDIYGGNGIDDRWNITHSGKFIYWKSGIYNLDTYLEGCGGGGCRVPWYPGHPLVWLAYPNESPEINANSVYGDAYLSFYNGISNLYIDGIDFNANSNTRGKLLSIATRDGNTVIRRNTFRGVTNCTSGGNNSLLFFENGSTGPYTAVQDNIAYDSCGYFLLGYESPFTLVESNTVTTNIPLPISPKHGNENWTIRGNVIQGNTTSGGIYLQEFGYSSNIEICYNLINMSDSNGVALKFLGSDPGGAIYTYRNTIIGHVNINSLTSSKGPWYFTKNVIINNSTSADKLTRKDSVDESRLILKDNLIGGAGENIVDSNGHLTSSYNNFIGNRGFEIGVKPLPPISATVQ